MWHKIIKISLIRAAEFLCLILATQKSTILSRFGLTVIAIAAHDFSDATMSRLDASVTRQVSQPLPGRKKQMCDLCVCPWNLCSDDLGGCFDVAYISQCSWRGMITASVSYISKSQSQYSSWQFVKVTVTTSWLPTLQMEDGCQWTMSAHLRKDVI